MDFRMVPKSSKSDAYKSFQDVFSKEDPGHYRLFGWMQIGQIIHLGKDPSWYVKEEPNAISHPHTIGSWGDNNTLYLASDKLDTFGLKDYYGFGKFKASERTKSRPHSSILAFGYNR